MGHCYGFGIFDGPLNGPLLWVWNSQWPIEWAIAMGWEFSMAHAMGHCYGWVILNGPLNGPLQSVGNFQWPLRWPLKNLQPIAMAHPIAQDPLSKGGPIGWGAIKTHCTKMHSVAASRRLKSSLQVLGWGI